MVSKWWPQECLEKRIMATKIIFQLFKKSTNLQIDKCMGSEMFIDKFMGVWIFYRQVYGGLKLNMNVSNLFSAFFQIIFGAIILFSKHFWGHHLLTKHFSYFSIFLWAWMIKIANFTFSISYEKMAISSKWLNFWKSEKAKLRISEDHLLSSFGRWIRIWSLFLKIHKF